MLAAILPALRRSIAMKRVPWWMIPTTWIWANLHGLWTAGLLMYGALVIGLAIEVGIRGWRCYLPFAGVGLASLLAAALTPNGPALLLAPFEVRDYARFVSEWDPPNLFDPFHLGAYLLLGIVIVGWARQTTPVPASGIMFVSAAAVLGLAYSRTVPLTAIAVAPLAAATLQQAFGHDWRPPLASTTDRVFVVSLTAIALALSAIWLPHVPGIRSDPPFDISARLDNLPGRAHVMNEYDLGGWLLWTARDVSPGIDGRTEIYSVDYVQNYVDALTLRGDWQSFVQAGEFDAAWLRSGSPLVFGLKSIGWTETYRNTFSVILLPPGQ
jgi:hypothetical protein